MKKKFIIMTAACAVIIMTVSVSGIRAQSVGGVLKSKTTSKVINTVSGYMRDLDLTGQWDYTGAAVAFESDNLLKKAGGQAAASLAEKRLDEQFSKLGIKPGITNFIFDEDGSFTNTMGGRTMKGHYSYDEDSDELTLRYLNLLPMKVKITGNSRHISMLFRSDNFLSLLSFFGHSSGIGVIELISSIVDSYDGMMIGLSLEKD